MKVHDILEKYQLSSRSFASLIDISPATVTYWQKNHEGEVPLKFERQAEIVLGCIDYVAKISNSKYKNVTPLIIEFKKSPFWKNWNHLKLVLSQSIDTDALTSYSDLHLEIERYINEQTDGAKLVKELPKDLEKYSLKFDLYLKNNKNNYILIHLIEKAITLKDIIEQLNDIEKTHKKFPHITFYIFAKEVKNSIKLTLEDMDYITLVETEIEGKVAFKKIK